MKWKMKDKELNILRKRLKSLTIFGDFGASLIPEGIYELLYALEEGMEADSLIETYSLLTEEIYRAGGDLGLVIREEIDSGDNIYVEKYLQDSLTPEMEKALEQDLSTLQSLSKLESKDLIKAMAPYISDIDKLGLPSWRNTKINCKERFRKMLKNVGTDGYGIYSKGIMFKIEDDQPVPVLNADYQTVDKLYEYERERRLVLNNTEALANGKVASNVLLYGDAGTGKSTTVKAAAAYYGKKGVRLIEFRKDQVSLIPKIAETLANSPLKFIFFIDDLTFSSNDQDYYALKGILEGNVSGTAPNILIYATSNRRHLIKESRSEREGDDIHLNDTLQETLSLSSRFGLTITFGKPEKDTYLSIVEKLALEQGLISKKDRNYDKKLEELFSAAEAFAIRVNGRSPRSAKQFVVLAGNNIN